MLFVRCPQKQRKSNIKLLFNAQAPQMQKRFKFRSGVKIPRFAPQKKVGDNQRQPKCVWQVAQTRDQKR